MDGSVLAAREVVAPLNFVDPSGPPPVRFQYPVPPDQAPPAPIYQGRQTRIIDARALALEPSLDREGFALIRRPTAVTDFHDEALIRVAYYAEVERLIREEIGAIEVVAFDHNVRNAALSAGTATVREPVKRVHNDYTERSAPQRLATLLGEERAASWRADGFSIVNLWRPLAEPVIDSPLALADSRTLAAKDLVVQKLIYRQRVGETYAIAWNPNQRWFWFPRMTRAEAILIRCFDSRVTGGVPFAAHGAFDDPTAPAGAPPRESIEVRTLVRWSPRRA